MKVSTDACIMGAYVQAKQAESILDIGTGTGLLALMLAQKTKNCPIEALEVEPGAFEQAKTNFQNAPWGNRLSVRHLSLQNYTQTAHPTYELIICNPPFFPKSLKGLNEKKNLALHNDSLSFKDLIHGAARLLSPEGAFWVMYPAYEMEEFRSLAEKPGLYCCHELTVFDKRGAKALRKIAQFRFQKPHTIIRDELIIKKEDSSYTPSFKSLLKAYYLIF